MSNELKDFLKNVLLFADLPASQMDKIVKLITEKAYPKYQVIFEEGEAGDVLYIIKSGLVKISKEASDGRVKTLALLKAGDFFGEMSVLSEEGRSANAETLSDAELLLMRRDDFSGLLDKNPSVSLHIIRTLIERLFAADRQIKNLALGNSRAKIADILLLLSQDFGDKSEDGTKVNVRLTHQELADLAGLARETTTKLLNEFVKDEAILLKDREIEIINTEKLAQWTM
jgi:CRP/FNR family cyclic AMP-dependent transcriptional regulator